MMGASMKAGNLRSKSLNEAMPVGKSVKPFFDCSSNYRNPSRV